MPATWTPPIGIPTPDWGVILENPIVLPRPSAPAGWTSAPTVDVPGYYFVNQATGVDDGRLGTPAAPRKYLPSSPAAGSVIFLEGAYTNALGSFAPAGSSIAPVWLLGWDVESRPSIQNGNFSFSSGERYCIIDNVNTFGTAVQVVRGASYLCFRECEIDLNEAESSGMLFYKEGSGWTEKIVIYGCKVTRCGDWQVTVGDPDRQGISFQIYQRDLWVVDSEMSYNSGCGVQIVSGTADLFATCTTRAYVGRCVTHHNNQVGIWSKRSVDCVFSQNVCYEMRRDNPAPGDGVEQGGLGGQYGHQNLWIIYNTVHTCQCGILIRSDDFASGEAVTDVHIIGNLIYNIHNTQPSSKGPLDSSRVAGTCISVWGGARTRIINNTCDDYDGGYYSRSAAPPFPRLNEVFGNSFTNRFDPRVARTFIADHTTNVITAVGHGMSTGHLVLLSSTGTLPSGTTANYYYITVINGDTFTLDGVDIFDAGTGVHTVTGPINLFDILVDYTNVSSVFDRNAFDNKFLYNHSTTNDVVPAGDIFIDPDNVSMPNRNYALAPGSDLIDVISTPSTVYADWGTSYPIRPSISVDRSGGARPWNAATDALGGNWDIGAYEYGSTIIPPPATPTLTLLKHFTPITPS